MVKNTAPKVLQDLTILPPAAVTIGAGGADPAGCEGEGSVREVTPGGDPSAVGTGAVVSRVVTDGSGAGTGVLDCPSLEGGGEEELLPGGTDAVVSHSVVTDSTAVLVSFSVSHSVVVAFVTMLVTVVSLHSTVSVEDGVLVCVVQGFAVVSAVVSDFVKVTVVARVVDPPPVPLASGRLDTSYDTEKSSLGV